MAKCTALTSSLHHSEAWRTRHIFRFQLKKSTTEACGADTLARSNLTCSRKPPNYVGRGLLPEVGLYLQEDEMSEHGANDQLLRQVVRATGGRYNPPVKAAFDAGGRSISTTMELWPGLLALAVLLDLAELLMRKWKGLMEGLGWRRAVEA